MDKKWRLHEDLNTNDSLLDGLTFDDLILSAHHTSVVTPETVKENLRDMLEQRLEDMWFLVNNNMDIIIREALKGRG